MERQIKRDYFRKAKQLGYLDVMPDIKERIYASERETNIIRIMTHTIYCISPIFFITFKNKVCFINT